MDYNADPDWLIWLESFRDWASAEIDRALVTVTPEQWALWTDLPYPDCIGVPRTERIDELRTAMASVQAARAYVNRHPRR